MSTMDDLVAWLRIQLDEDELVALAASPGPWEPNAEHDEVVAVDGITVAEGFALSGNQLRATVDHIARWDPARVLAEVETKRRVAKLYENALAAHRAGSISVRNQTQDEAAVEVLDEAVRALALPYADRPGYLPEWRPA